MVGIRSSAIPQHFRVDTGAPGSRMFQFFQDHHAGSLPHHKSTPVFVKRDGTPCRVCAVRQGCQGGKSRDPNGGYGPFCPSSHHHIRLTVLDGPECLPDGMGSCGAGCGHIQAFSLQAVEDAHVSRRHVRDHQRHKKRPYPGRPLLRQPAALPLHGLEAAHAASNATAYPIRIFFLHHKAGIGNGFPCCRHCILAKQFHPPGCLPVHILFRLEVFHFCRQPAFIARGVKPGNRGEACLLLQDTLPEGLHPYPNGRHCAQASHYYTSAHSTPF